MIIVKAQILLYNLLYISNISSKLYQQFSCSNVKFYVTKCSFFNIVESLLLNFMLLILFIISFNIGEIQHGRYPPERTQFACYRSHPYSSRSSLRMPSAGNFRCPRRRRFYRADQTVGKSIHHEHILKYMSQEYLKFKTTFNFPFHEMNKTVGQSSHHEQILKYVTGISKIKTNFTFPFHEMSKNVGQSSHHEHILK